MTTNQRLNNEAEFQNKRVADGGGGRKFQHLISDEYPYLLKTIGNVNNKKILVMGCATGGVTPFARVGATVVGIDISIDALNQLNAAIQKEQLSSFASVSLMDCEQLSFKEKTFDIILFIGVLHHLDVKKNMVECFRILKPDGKIIMSEPLGLHPMVNAYRILTPRLRTEFEHPLKPKDFKIMGEYYHVEEFKGFCLTSIFSLIGLYIFKNEAVYQSLRRALIRLDNIIFEKLPVLKYFAWSAVIKLNKKN